MPHKQWGRVFAMGMVVVGRLIVGAGPALGFEDAIVAVVNDTLITYKDISNYMTLAAQQLKASGRPAAEVEKILDEVRETVVDRIIEERLILSAAQAKGIEIRPQAIDAKMAELRKNYPSDREFFSAVAEDGMTVTDIRGQIADQLKSKYFLDEEIRSRVMVNPQDVTAYYAAHEEEFVRPERVNLDSIFIPAGSEEERLQAEEKANAAYERVMAGEDFRAVAQEFSSNPALGVISRGQLRPEIEREIFALPLQRVSKPLSLPEGFVIVKMMGKTEQERLPLDEVKGRIRDHLFQKQFQQEFRKWMDEAKAKAYIEIKGP